MSSSHYSPKKSLRTVLMMWFLVFSVVPLAFITGYSLVKYEQAIDQEMSQRLKANRREIEGILREYESALKENVRKHASNKSLIFYLSGNRSAEVNRLAKKWMGDQFAPHRLSIFNRKGRLVSSMYFDGEGKVKSKQGLREKQYYLSKNFLGKVNGSKPVALIDIRGKESVDLVVFSQVLTSGGSTLGYVEEIIEMDDSFLEGLQDRLGLQVAFFSPSSERVVSTHSDLELYKPSFFLQQIPEKSDRVFDITVREKLYAFSLRPLQWGKEKLFMVLGASKEESQAVLKNVNLAFFTVFGAVVLLVIILSVIISRVLLRPVTDLLNAIQKVDLDQDDQVEVKTSSETELGVLALEFNDMFRRVHDAQSELKSKLGELKKANSEIRDTQAKLVHSGKMASLGQLVAGVAHELNNPIGFIYSNMGHLRDYSEKLIHLVAVAEKTPKQLAKEKKEAEFDYIVDDMPKLITSCEDGARRTRDIVLGLRNFSRLEEAKLKAVNIEESIETTLQLLAGELKGRIKIETDYAKLPKVTCYPSQLNQVFMNILSNATQAIKTKGTINIKTKKVGKDKVSIHIKDSGKGMNSETAEKIFDPFFTTKNLGQGTGLGLSISYGVVQKHGGDIQVKSSKGKGTEFIVTLPIKP